MPGFSRLLLRPPLPYSHCLGFTCRPHQRPGSWGIGEQEWNLWSAKKEHDFHSLTTSVTWFLSGLYVQRSIRLLLLAPLAWCLSPWGREECPFFPSCHHIFETIFNKIVIAIFETNFFTTLNTMFVAIFVMIFITIVSTLLNTQWFNLCRILVLVRRVGRNL